MPKIKIQFVGLVGVEIDRGGSMIVHCVNASNPALLNVPDRFKMDIPPHLPRLLFRGETRPARGGDLSIQSGALSCGATGTWSAVNLLGWEVIFVGLTGALDDSNLNLLTMRTLLGEVGTPSASLNLAWPRTAASLIVPGGTVKNGTSRGTWEFAETVDREWELHEDIVVENEDAQSPLSLLFRWLPNMNIVRRLTIEHAGNLVIRVENNVIAQRERDDCRGGRDFVGHYHLTASELAAHPHPERKTGVIGGGTNNAQCSPIQYRP